MIRKKLRIPTRILLRANEEGFAQKRISHQEEDEDSPVRTCVAAHVCFREELVLTPVQVVVLQDAGQRELQDAGDVCHAVHHRLDRQLLLGRPHRRVSELL